MKIALDGLCVCTSMPSMLLGWTGRVPVKNRMVPVTRSTPITTTKK